MVIHVHSIDEAINQLIVEAAHCKDNNNLMQ